MRLGFGQNSGKFYDAIDSNPIRHRNRINSLRQICTIIRAISLPNKLVRGIESIQIIHNIYERKSVLQIKVNEP